MNFFSRKVTKKNSFLSRPCLEGLEIRLVPATLNAQYIVELQTHPVAVFYDHLSILITPQNPSLYHDADSDRHADEDPLFFLRPDGSYALSLGGGPASNDPLAPGLLISDFNRERDIDPARHPASNRITLTKPDLYSDSRAWVNALISRAAGYSDAVDYDYFPDATNLGRNSNSFIAGLLNATNTVVSDPDTLFAGSDHVGYAFPVATAKYGSGPAQRIDLVFVVDTTNSMSDDIAAVKASATQIINDVVNQYRVDGQADARIAVMDYRDFSTSPYGKAGDYPFRDVQVFTANAQTAVGGIQSLSLGDGGDNPESVFSGLMHAIQSPSLGQWRGDGVRKVIILIGDAPGHDPEPFTGYTASTVSTAAINEDPVVVFPVGIGSFDESQLRAIATATGGQFLQTANAATIVPAILTTLGTISSSPTAEANGPYTRKVGTPITFSAAGTFDPNGTIVKYEWDWDEDGTWDTTTTTPTALHTYLAPYSGRVRLRVTDNDGLTALDIADVTSPENLNPDADNNTSLLLRMDNTTNGYGGEKPVKSVGTSFGEGVRNQALNVDSGGYVQYSNFGNIDSQKGTVEFWVKPNWNGNQNTTHLFFNTGHNFNNGMVLSMDGANNLRFIRWGDDPSTAQMENNIERGLSTSGASWLAENWYHLAATWDGNTGGMELYINGTLVDSRTDGVRINSFSGENMTIGADQFIAQPGNCNFDQFRISNITRNAQEIQSSFLGNYTSPENLNPPIIGNRVQKYPTILAMRSPFMDGSMELVDSTTSVIIKSNFTPFPGYHGGVQVQSGDFDGLNKGIVIAAGEGGAPHVIMMDSNSGLVTHSFFAYSTAFRGGLFIAVGDINNDGADDFVTGPNAGGGPHIKVFDGRTASVLFEFMAYNPSFTGGVSVALADVNQDGRLDIITGTGKGGGPHVCVFDALNGQLLKSFMAFDSNFFGGVYVASGDIDRDGVPEIVTGMGSGGVPLVNIFNSKSLSQVNQFYAYDRLFSGGVRVGLSDQNLDGILDIFTGAGPGGGPHVRVFHGISLNEIGGYFAGIPGDPYGVYVNSGSGTK